MGPTWAGQRDYDCDCGVRSIRMNVRTETYIQGYFDKLLLDRKNPRCVSTLVLS